MNSFNIFDFIFSVSLQPFEYDPQEKNRHKFMVQSMFAPEGDLNQDTLVNISLKTLHNKLKMENSAIRISLNVDFRLYFEDKLNFLRWEFFRIFVPLYTFCIDCTDAFIDISDQLNIFISSFFLLP